MDQQTGKPEAPLTAETTEAPETPKKKLTRRERRKRWKAAKKAKREELREYYRYAPAGKRLWNLYLKKPLGTLLVLAAVLLLIAVNLETLFVNAVVPAIAKSFDDLANEPLTREERQKVYEQAPIDEEGAAKIEALSQPVGEDETWTVCVYIVGSNVEDFGQNGLSEVTRYETDAAGTALVEEKRAEMRDMFGQYCSTLEEQGPGLPSVFYRPVVPVEQDAEAPADINRTGYGSRVIEEVTSGVWPDTVNVVIQTGGATHWSNQMVNPNRTQRFNYCKGEFREVANLPIQQASDPDTLADFLRFCEEEYPADHRILVFWDHGGGPFGYGHDSIFGGLMSLKDIRTALKSVYTPNSSKPPFEIIGFDACLMANLEVTHALDGFADFYCLSEESEPAPGWDHHAWLQAMTDRPGISAAEIARTVADAYIDRHVGRAVKFPLISLDVTFSVINAHKAEELYDAYCALAEAQLKDAAEDIGVLAEIGRCANKSTRFAGSDANVFNTIDLGNYTDYLTDLYPEECSRIRALLDETVLYHRENGALSDATGLSVYFPTEINDLYGLQYYLNYVNRISEDDSVTALYYYKQSGCLTDEMREYVATLTDSEPKTLDVTPFYQFGRETPDFDSEGFLFPVSEALQDLIVDYEMEIARSDAGENRLVSLGRDRVLWLDGEGHLASEFDGRWIHLNGEPLFVEPVSASASAVEYRAHVRYNREEAYLLISRDRDTDMLSITGLRKVTNEPNYMIAGHSTFELKGGDRIAPLYEITDLTTGELRTETGKQVTWTGQTDLEFKPLDDGEYLATAVISDQRGDSYYSAVVGTTVSRGAPEDWRAEPGFYGRDY